MRNPDSVFLEEIPNELLKREGYQIVKKHKVTSAPSVKRKIVQEENNVNNLSKGDKIKHKVFGEGIVVSVAGDQCVIAFAKPHGIKTLLKDHPSITKLS